MLRWAPSCALKVKQWTSDPQFPFPERFKPNIKDPTMQRMVKEKLCLRAQRIFGSQTGM